jgi:hypothetical protein
MTRAHQLCLLAAVLVACGGPERWPLRAQRLDRGPPPPARATLHGSRVFLVFEEVMLTGDMVILAVFPWPADATAPRAIDAYVECPYGPGPTQHLELGAMAPGERFYLTFYWSKLCPSPVVPAPQRTRLTLQLIDLCAAGQCETLSGTLEVGPYPDPWPAYPTPPRPPRP